MNKGYRTVRVLVLAAFLLSAGLAFAAGEAEPENEEQTELAITSWLVASQEIYEEGIIAPFEAENPSVSVEITTAPWSEYWQKIQTQYAAGDTPDVYDMSVAYLHTFARRGMVENLQPLVDSDLNLNDYVAESLNPGRYPDADGDLYSLHTLWGSGVLFYNKTMFDSAGIPYPDDSWTWETLGEVARELTMDTDGDGTTDQWGFLAETGYYLHFNVIKAFGGEVLNEERTASTINSPEAIEATEFLVGMIEDGTSPSPVVLEGLGNPFQTGRVAMVFAGSFNIQAFRDITEFDWDIAVAPEGPAQRSTYVGGNPSKVISSMAADKDAAWNFIQWVMNNQTVDNILLPGTFPNYRPTLETWLEEEADSKPESLNVVLDSTAFGYGLYESLAWAEWYSAYRNELSLAFLGDASVPDALNAAHTAINEILAAQ